MPYSLKRLWFELLEPEIKTWADQARTQPALVEKGDAETLRPPKFQPPGAGSSLPHANQTGVLGIRRQLDQFRSRLLDRQYDFLLHPGPWEPKVNGDTAAGLPDLLRSWLGHDKPITVLDLSGVPSIVLSRMLGAILRIVFDSLFWGRAKSEGGIGRPLLVVLEEAHRYLGKEQGSPARDMVQRIVKEGRKFGVGAMLVSQRPSEVDETVLSQCGTFFALRLSNTGDRTAVQSTLPDSLAGLVASLPALRTGEALVTGEAASLPIRCRVTLPPPEGRPSSSDAPVYAGWAQQRKDESYERLAASWRAQNPRWAAMRLARIQVTDAGDPMEREFVSSSNVISIGYQPDSETLEVEFKDGAVYQYYNVPEPVHSSLMMSESKGKFMHAHIRNQFPYSRV